MDTEGTRLAELNLRHTRRHMPTRRVALEPSYLPTAGGAAGSDLLAAVVAEFVPQIDEETRVRVPWLLRRVGDGALEVPSVHLHHRLQTDTHGLDRSRHRVVEEQGRTVVELDLHGAATPQVLGAVLAAASLPIKRLTLTAAAHVVAATADAIATGIQKYVNNAVLRRG